MLDRSIRVAIDRVGISQVFADLAPVFSSHDAVIMNLEGPITTFPTVSVGTVPGTPNNFRFTFDPSVLEYLKTFPLIVNIGNNHIRDFNLEGVQQTKKYLEEADIPYFGNSGFEAEPSERVLLLENENGTIAYVNYNQFIADGYNTAMADLEFASTQSRADLVVLYTHWGSEYVEVPNSTIKNQAIAFFDAGADLIVGTHPHVIQPWEDVQGKRVYYSLGNTVFDQYFSAATRRGMLVSAEWDGLDLEFSEQYVLMEGSGRTILEESDLN